MGAKENIKDFMIKELIEFYTYAINYY